MKVLDYLEKLPMGEVVRNKRVLAVLKRKGLIFDYSQWGYLEDCRIWFNEEYRGKTERWDVMRYLFHKGNAPRESKEYVDGTKYLNNRISLDCDREEVYNTYGCDDVIEYKGHYFTTQYLSGCFNAYLVKCDKHGCCDHKRSMCLWGAVI